LDSPQVVHLGTELLLVDELQCVNEMALLSLFVEVRVIVVCNFLEGGGVERGDPVESILVRAEELIQLFETARNFGEFAWGQLLLLGEGVV